MIEADFPRLTLYVELLLLANLRINHITQAAFCNNNVFYEEGDETHLAHHPRLACCNAVLSQLRRVDHAME
eukprot:4023308-Amphidinium_carterae.1